MMVCRNTGFFIWCDLIKATVDNSEQSMFKLYVFICFNLDLHFIFIGQYFLFLFSCVGQNILLGNLKCGFILIKINDKYELL